LCYQVDEGKFSCQDDSRIKSQNGKKFGESQGNLKAFFEFHVKLEQIFINSASNYFSFISLPLFHLKIHAQYKNKQMKSFSFSNCFLLFNASLTTCVVLGFKLIKKRKMSCKQKKTETETRSGVFPFSNFVGNLSFDL
jgi:hypothetical protein